MPKTTKTYIAIVTIPKPPIWINKAKTILPNIDKVSAMFGIVDNPVTQTAEVDKNSESTQDSASTPALVANGSFRSSIPNRIMLKKLIATTAKGDNLCFFI
jgi:hypothetical protein